MRIRKLALCCLVLHALVAVFSLTGTWAMYNLSQIPDWDYNALTFWLGIANVLTGVFTTLFLMGSREGWKPTLSLLMLCIVLAGGMELLGTTTGIPFGSYSYTDLLGPKLLGHVPYLIPLSWMMMLYPAMMLAETLLPQSRWRPIAAGGILTIWDFAMDPAMTTGFAYWQWHTEGGFYGMPYINWLGWWLTGTLVAVVFWKVCPHWKGQWEPLALTLYLIQGGFMAGLAWLYMRPMATLLWSTAVAMLMVLLWKRHVRVPTLQGVDS
ncbi:MAG: carotenoid biosynthesis protein [Armatimonadota bacterium]